MTSETPTASEMITRTAEIYCGQRHLAGASAAQVRQELLGLWFQMHDREFTGNRWMSNSNGWPTPMHERAFHGLAGDLVRAIEPHTEADPPALLVQFLGLFGSAAGRNSFVRVEDARHFPNLFVVVFGPTSTGKKGTSLSRVLQVTSLADAEWFKLCVSQGGGLSSGEGLIHAVRDPNADRLDSGVTDKRLLVIESEFGSVLKMMAREGNCLSSVLRNAWDHGVLTNKTKHSPAAATGAHISLIGHVTREEFSRRIDKAEIAGGTMNRILHVASRRSKELPFGASLPAKVMQPLVTSIRRSLDFAREQREMSFSPHAKRLWECAYSLLTADRIGQYGEATARAAPQVLRLSLIFALLDRSEMISEEHLWAALAVWEYCDRSAHYVYGDLLGDRAQDQALDAIRAHGGWIAKGELVDALKRHVFGECLSVALAGLAAAGLVEAREERTGGRPRELFRAIKARKASLLELCSLSSQDSAEAQRPDTFDSYAGDERDAVQSERPGEHDGAGDAGRDL